MENLYSEKKHKDSITIAKKILSLDPDNPEANLIIGRVSADFELYNEALPYLYKVTEQDKTNSFKRAWALFYIGKCNYVLSNHAAAKSALKEAIEMKVIEDGLQTPQRWLRLLGYDDMFSGWTTYESNNFNFHFQPDTKVKYINVYINFREIALQKINKFFKVKLPKKIDFYVWHTPDYAFTFLDHPNHPSGFALPGAVVIHSHYKQSPGHELTHILSHYIGVESSTKFINEGIAVYFNQIKANRVTVAKMAIKKFGISVISIKDLWKSMKSGMAGTYSLAGAFIEHLIEKEGKDKMLNLLKNQTLENAQEIYGAKRLDKLISEFESKLSC